MIALFGEQSEHLSRYLFIIFLSVMALNYHSFMSENQPAKTHTNMLYLNRIHFEFTFIVQKRAARKFS